MLKCFIKLTIIIAIQQRLLLIIINIIHLKIKDLIKLNKKCRIELSSCKRWINRNKEK